MWQWVLGWPFAAVGAALGTVVIGLSYRFSTLGYSADIYYLVFWAGMLPPASAAVGCCAEIVARLPARHDPDSRRDDGDAEVPSQSVRSRVPRRVRALARGHRRRVHRPSLPAEHDDPHRRILPRHVGTDGGGALVQRDVVLVVGRARRARDARPRVVRGLPARRGAARVRRGPVRWLPWCMPSTPRRSTSTRSTPTRASRSTSSCGPSRSPHWRCGHPSKRARQRTSPGSGVHCRRLRRHSSPDDDLPDRRAVGRHRLRWPCAPDWSAAARRPSPDRADRRTGWPSRSPCTRG